jgi:hypothetical protein
VAHDVVDDDRALHAAVLLVFVAVLRVGSYAQDVDVVNNVSTSSAPLFRRTRTVKSEALASPVVATVKRQVTLPSGLALRMTGTASVAFSATTNVVAEMARTGSGVISKSTLIPELFFACVRRLLLATFVFAVVPESATTIPFPALS